MAVDREAIKWKAIRAIDQASDEELARARRDEGYAHSWLQSLIGWIANLLTILSHIFGGCYITTAVVEHFGLNDDCDLLADLRKFRDEYINESGCRDRLLDLEKYYLLAPSILRWVKCHRESERLWAMLQDGVMAGHRAVKRGEFGYAYELFKQMGPHFQLNSVLRPAFLRNLLARHDACEDEFGRSVG